MEINHHWQTGQLLLSENNQINQKAVVKCKAVESHTVK